MLLDYQHELVELNNLSKLINKPLIDHYIVADKEMVSFVERRLLEEFRDFESKQQEFDLDR